MHLQENLGLFIWFFGVAFCLYNWWVVLYNLMRGTRIKGILPFVGAILCLIGGLVALSPWYILFAVFEPYLLFYMAWRLGFMRTKRTPDNPHAPIPPAGPPTPPM